MCGEILEYICKNEIISGRYALLNKKCETEISLENEKVKYSDLLIKMKGLEEEYKIQKTKYELFALHQKINNTHTEEINKLKYLSNVYSEALWYRLFGCSISFASTYAFRKHEFTLVLICSSLVMLCDMGRIMYLYYKNKEIIKEQKSKLIKDEHIEEKDDIEVGINALSVKMEKNVSEYSELKKIIDAQEVLLQEIEKKMYESVQNPTEFNVQNEVVLFFMKWPKAVILEILNEDFFKRNKNNNYVYSILKEIFSGYFGWKGSSKQFADFFGVKEKKEFAYTIFEKDRVEGDEKEEFCGYLKLKETILQKMKEEGGKREQILLYGPPGNGKTTLVRRLAYEYAQESKNNKIYFFYLNPMSFSKKSDFSDLLFQCKELKEKEKECNIVLFFDELDGIIPRNDCHDMSASFKTFCEEIKDSLIYIFGATNYKDSIEEASIRDGRFAKFEMKNPDYKQRAKLIDLLFKGISNEKALLNLMLCGKSTAEIKKMSLFPNIDDCCVIGMFEKQLSNYFKEDVSSLKSSILFELKNNFDILRDQDIYADVASEEEMINSEWNILLKINWKNLLSGYVKKIDMCEKDVLMKSEKNHMPEQSLNISELKDVLIKIFQGTSDIVVDHINMQCIMSARDILVKTLKDIGDNAYGENIFIEKLRAMIGEEIDKKNKLVFSN